MAMLVNALNGDRFPLAHGGNIIGRESKSTVPGEGCRLPLKISMAEANISRNQACLTVANHADGIRVTLQTHRDAKNPTRLRKAERFGTKRGHISLKPAEIIPIKHGDLIELDSVKRTGSYAFRLEIEGSTSKFSGKDVELEAQFTAFRGGGVTSSEDAPEGEDSLLAAVNAACDSGGGGDDDVGHDDDDDGNGSDGTLDDGAELSSDDDELIAALRLQDATEVSASPASYSIAASYAVHARCVLS